MVAYLRHQRLQDALLRTRFRQNAVAHPDLSANGVRWVGHRARVIVKLTCNANFLIRARNHLIGRGRVQQRKAKKIKKKYKFSRALEKFRFRQIRFRVGLRVGRRLLIERVRPTGQGVAHLMATAGRGTVPKQGVSQITIRSGFWCGLYHMQSHDGIFRLTRANTVLRQQQFMDDLNLCHNIVSNSRPQPWVIKFLLGLA